MLATTRTRAFAAAQRASLTTPCYSCAVATRVSSLDTSQLVYESSTRVYGTSYSTSTSNATHHNDGYVEEDELEVEAYSDGYRLAGDDADGSVNELRLRILEAAMEHVETHGWSTDALIAGAKAVGYPSITHGMFQRGPGELVEHFNYVCNAQVALYMAENPKAADADSLDYIHDVFKRRLELVIPYKYTWSQALALQIKPANVAKATKSAALLVDEVCHAVGHTSLQPSAWYGKRAGLAAAYAATELYMLSDTSPGFEATWQFLRRSLEREAALEFAGKKLRNAAELAGLFASVATKHWASSGRRSGVKVGELVTEGVGLVEEVKAEVTELAGGRGFDSLVVDDGVSVDGSLPNPPR